MTPDPATITAMDTVLREFYLPAWPEELELRLVSEDGRSFVPVPVLDEEGNKIGTKYQAALLGTYYGRISIQSESIMAGPASVARALQDETDALEKDMAKMFCEWAELLRPGATLHHSNFLASQAESVALDADSDRL